MPLPKKKTASKASKASGSGARKAPSTKFGGGAKPKPAAKKTVVSKKSAAAAKKGVSKKASAKLKSSAASKKVSATQPGNKGQIVNTAVKKKRAGKVAAGKETVQKDVPGSQPESSGSGRRIDQVKADKKLPRTIDSKRKSTEEIAKSAVSPEASPATKTSAAKKKKGYDSGLADSISQGLAKPGQKKRGWRDIEALTERARLKNLLSDIWHEDIDLDSDIFGETDQFSSYYTDKEEEIEVDDDEDEEWEEFEEDES